MAKQFGAGNIFSDTLRSLETIGESFVDSVKNDVFKDTAKTAGRQIFGTEISENGRSEKTSGVLKQSEELTLSVIEDLRKREYEQFSFAKKRFEGGEFLLGRDCQISQQVEMIRVELAKLVKGQNEVTTEIFEIETAAAKIPKKPGKYHLLFFEKLLSLIRLARIRIEEARNWLSIHKGRCQKKNFWDYSDELGTQFQLSSEHYMIRSTG